MDLGLAGRVAVVTGSSQGIGRATALLFGSEGARVALRPGFHPGGPRHRIRVPGRPLRPPGVTMQISTTSGPPRPRSPRPAQDVAT
jgi:hypothetical protein